MSHKNCITHSLACDCREEQFRLLKERNKELESLIEKLDEIRKFYANKNNWLRSNRDDCLTIPRSDHSLEDLVAGNSFEIERQYKCGGKRARALEQDKTYQEYINNKGD